MTTDRELRACANTLIQQHGAEGWFASSTRAEQLLAAGELEGHRTFVRILDRINQLEGLTPAIRVH